MTVRIVTDSIADLPENIVRELNITVVPVVVNFGQQTFRDGVDMTPEQFYDKLKISRVFPHTSVPSPGVFRDVYDQLAGVTDQVLVISVSSLLTATCSVALQAVKLMTQKCHVEVIDSRWATMAQGFIVMAAARAALRGAGLAAVKDIALATISRVEFHATFDTLEYLRRGGRIGRAQALAGSILKVNPVITLQDGAVYPVERVRSRSKAIERLFAFAQSCPKIEEMAVEDVACPDEAAGLVERLKALHPGKTIYRSKMTPAIGTHTGPGLLSVAVQGKLHPRA